MYTITRPLPDRYVSGLLRALFSWRLRASSTCIKQILALTLLHIHTLPGGRLCGSWGPVSMWKCVLSSALICNALAWRCSRRRGKRYGCVLIDIIKVYISITDLAVAFLLCCELAFTRYCHYEYCMVYGITKEDRGSYIGQKSRNSIAVVWAMQIGGGNKGVIDSCTHTNK